MNRAKDKAMERILEEILREVAVGSGKVGLKPLLQWFLNHLMEVERDLFLRHSENNKANGFYPRSLVAGSMNLGVRVPRDRNGDFRPRILPSKWRRSTDDYTSLLVSLVANGYSDAEIARALKGLGLHYSVDEMQEIRDRVRERVQDFKSRELKSDWAAVFIDAYPTKVKDKTRVRDAAVYIFIGLDMDGNKELLHFEVVFGKENKGTWVRIFQDLIQRGLKRPLLVVSDDFSGLREALLDLFPMTDHQLCYVHLMRNVRRQMRREDSKEFIHELKLVRMARDFEGGVQKFRELCERYADSYPTFMESLMKKVENYLAFQKYPESIRKYLYTTNTVENFNSLLEKVRLDVGGYFQSQELLDINTVLIHDRLKDHRWSKPVPAVHAASYELKQLFALKFGSKD